MAETIIGVLGIALTSLGLTFGYASWRRKELRKDEILSWANDCIDVLQRTHLAVATAAKCDITPDLNLKLEELALRSSVQVERGRLFFRNVQHAWGAEKPEAYRGLRPLILDCLVANFQICEKATSCNREELQVLDVLSLDYARKFVSLAQAEVGRSSRSKSPAENAGRHVSISADMADFVSARIAAIEK